MKPAKLEWEKDVFVVDGGENLDFSGSNNYQSAKDALQKTHHQAMQMLIFHAHSTQKDSTLVLLPVSMAEKFWAVENSK